LQAGLTALMMASREGHADIVQMLVDAGADPDVRADMDSMQADHDWVMFIFYISLVGCRRKEMYGFISKLFAEQVHSAHVCSRWRKF
jgi:ankyrin repeat protein